MRIMAIDYGDTRTGVAVSDISATLVGDAWVINCKKLNALAEIIINEAASRSVKRIIVGYPKNMDGSIGPRAKKCNTFAGLLRSLSDIETILWDERLTTVSAHKILDTTGKFGKKRKQTLDALAASIILESCLNSL